MKTKINKKTMENLVCFFKYQDREFMSDYAIKKAYNKILRDESK